MRSSSLALAAAALVTAACGDSKPAAFQVVAGDNVMPVSVNGAHCGGAGTPFVNQPCVSVKVCVPGSANCQTVDDVLLDTGSVGLRLFRQALPLTFPSIPAPGGGALAECVQFADLTADWGPVVSADVVLANEPAVTLPIQIIDATFGAVPSSCPSPETAPTSINGVLGVGVFIADCGAICPAEANIYFASDGSSSTPVAVDVSVQVANPVAVLPVDNNGIIIALPGVPGTGAPSVEGAVVLGIATRSNNVPVSASAIGLDRAGEFTTTLNGGTVIGGSFVDTGSNGLFFSPPFAIPSCTDAQDWYCPASTVAFSASNGPSPGVPGNHVSTPFQIASFDALVQTAGPNAVFSDIGGPGIPGGGFDWGLPFFLGRTVYLAIDARSSRFGTGPLLAY
jgi:hypothetical protein